MSNPLKFHIHTLGCKINQYESQSLREAWAARGLEEAPSPQEADLLVVNSCAVTNRAVADLRRTTRRMLRENPGARLVITGCAAQVLSEELARDFPDALLVPQEAKDALLDPAALDAPACSGSGGPGGPRFQGFSISGSSRARGVVKVQDGCSHRCTYCIVPDTRGPAVSRPVGDALAEVRRLFASGWREVTLSGINLRQFGGDLDPAMDFWDLVARLEAELAPEWAGRARLRLSSLDPGQLDDKALDVLATSRLVCPHLHISVQSLAPAVLRRMGRGHYAPEDILAWVDRLGGVWPVFGLGADLLVGFPGETDEHFEQTLQNCEKLPLSYAHVFPYSCRPGTPAAAWPDQVPAAVSRERAARLRGLVGDKKAAFLSGLASLPELTMVPEGKNSGRGVSEFYAECRLAKPARVAPGSLVRVRPVSAGPDFITVTPANDAATGNNE
ncbi:MiaB/RimO family radical SAM methylthiotransferase [Desulfocurvus sp. DL9XJH121]